MSYYRLYYLGTGGEHIVDVKEFQAKNDLDAIVKAGIPLLGEMRELWNCDRKVLGLCG